MGDIKESGPSAIAFDLNRIAEALWRGSAEVPERYTFRRLPISTQQYWRRVAEVAVDVIRGPIERRLIAEHKAGRLSEADLAKLLGMNRLEVRARIVASEGGR